MENQKNPSQNSNESENKASETSLGKRAMGTIAVIGVASIVVLGGLVGISMLTNNDDVKTQSAAGNPEMSGSEFGNLYVSNVELSSSSSFASLSTKDDDRGYITHIEFDVDKDDLTNNAVNVLEFTVTYKQTDFSNGRVPEDQNNRILSLIPSDDVELEDSNDDEVNFIDASSSLIDGKDKSKEQTFDGSNEVQVVYSVELNSDASDVDTIKEWEDVGDKYLIDLGILGKQADVSLEMKN